jgi:Family of unknown function (DUF5670)
MEGFLRLRMELLGGFMLWAILVISLALWIPGFSLHVAGSLIDLLLVLVVIGLVYNLLTGRRRAL